MLRYRIFAIYVNSSACHRKQNYRIVLQMDRFDPDHPGRTDHQAGAATNTGLLFHPGQIMRVGTISLHLDGIIGTIVPALVALPSFTEVTVLNVDSGDAHDVVLFLPDSRNGFR